MQAIGRQPQRAPDGVPVRYERHRPEQTTLYRLVQHHPAICIAHTEASTGGELPRFVKATGPSGPQNSPVYHVLVRLPEPKLAHGFF